MPSAIVRLVPNIHCGQVSALQPTLGHRESYPNEERQPESGRNGRRGRCEVGLRDGRSLFVILFLFLLALQQRVIIRDELLGWIQTLEKGKCAALAYERRLASLRIHGRGEPGLTLAGAEPQADEDLKGG